VAEPQRVSVIVPFSNRADSLEDSLSSVVSQTGANALELILVDDGSTDGSSLIASSFLNHADGRVIRLNGPSGVARARNVGLDAATHPIVAFQDSDDAWRPEKLCLQLELLASDRSLGVIGGGRRTTWPGGSSEMTPHIEPRDYRDAVLQGAPGSGTPLLLVDRTLTGDVRFDDHLPALEDRDYVWQSLRSGSRYAAVPSVIVDVTRGRPDHVATPARALTAMEYLIDKYASFVAEDAGLRARWHEDAMRNALRLGRARHAVRHWRAAGGSHLDHRMVELSFGVLGRAKGLSVARRLIELFEKGPTSGVAPD
jgi:glycosyltransferase involved in cell wall biosynthesis